MSAIALGSNLGNSLETLEGALDALGQTSGIEVQSFSSWYKTAPIGPAQPDYLNGCAILAVTLSPNALLTALQAIENQFGRVRQERWGPRTLDLDILLFDDLVMNTPDLTIPHPLMSKRAFVLVPLSEIAPDWIDPVSEHKISQLKQTVDCSDVEQLRQESANKNEG